VFVSETIIPAVYMAVDDVNANCSLITGYKLQVDFVDTLVCSYWYQLDPFIGNGAILMIIYTFKSVKLILRLADPVRCS
jgi:hypothetical protein